MSIVPSININEINFKIFENEKDAINLLKSEDYVMYIGGDTIINVYGQKKRN